MATMILLGAQPVLAAPSAYDQAFVSAFADACIPGRLSYEATQQTAMAAGWVATDFGADPQLAIIETLSADVAKKLEPLKGKMVFAVYAKVIEGVPHYLVTSFADLGSTGRPEMSWFQGLSAGNTRLPSSVAPIPTTADGFGGSSRANFAEHATPTIAQAAATDAATAVVRLFSICCLIVSRTCNLGRGQQSRSCFGLSGIF